MSVIVALSLSATAAPPTFGFAGQPDCVALSYADGRTQLRNDCEHALLIDQSVGLGSGPAFTVVPAAGTTSIRDLSAFTLGMDGELYRVVAWMQAPSEPADVEAAPAEATAEAEPEPAPWGEWLHGALAFLSH